MELFSLREQVDSISYLSDEIDRLNSLIQERETELS